MAEPEISTYYALRIKYTDGRSDRIVEPDADGELTVQDRWLSATRVPQDYENAKSAAEFQQQRGRNVQSVEVLVRTATKTTSDEVAEAPVPPLPTEPGIYVGRVWREGATPLLHYTLDNAGTWRLYWSGGTHDVLSAPHPADAREGMVRLVREPSA